MTRAAPPDRFDPLPAIGDFAGFFVYVVSVVPRTIRRYPREVLKQLQEVAWGHGALVVGGGSIVIMLMMSLSGGAVLGIQGYTSLQILGLSPLTGLIASIANTREFAPIISALAFGAQMGCRFCAELGSMKISEEIDALEAMAIDSRSYLATTRVIASMIASVPLMLIGLIASYTSTEIAVVVLYGQSAGQFQHYFATFLQPVDILYAVIKMVAFTGAIAMIMCWYGLSADRGPEGVGKAAGRAIRASIVSVVLIDMTLTLVFWAGNPIRLSG